MYPIQIKKIKKLYIERNFTKKGSQFSQAFFFQLYPYIFSDELFNYKYII